MGRVRKPLTRGRLLIWCAIFAGALLAALALGASWGAGEASLLGLLVGRPMEAVQRTILLDVRIPRVLMAAVLGGSLTAAGVAFQAILRNPLADPYVLGVSGGASIGGVVALLAGLGSGAAASVGVPACAFLGAVGALALIERIATIGGRLTVYSLLLTGAIFNAFSGALIYFIQSLASLEELHEIVFYLMGRIPSAGYGTVWALGLASVAGTLALWSMARDFNALSLGEEGAAQLGVGVESVKRRTFVLGSLLTALSVSAAGLVGFVGLVVPHLLRLLLGPDHRLLLPAAFLGGAGFLVLADLGARLLLAPNEMPVGVVTALIGGPFFLYLLRRGKGGYGFA